MPLQQRAKTRVFCQCGIFLHATGHQPGQKSLLFLGLVETEPAAQIGAQMERDFEEKGLAAASTALLLNQALSIRVEHARYLTHHDLCAMTALQYAHAGLEAIWQILECALLSPEREERVALEGGASLHYRDGHIVLAGNVDHVNARQAMAILAAHGLETRTG